MVSSTNSSNDKDAAAAAMTFKEQMATLQERSLATMDLGPPAWLTRPYCLEGPLSADEVRLCEVEVKGGWCEILPDAYEETTNSSPRPLHPSLSTQQQLHRFFHDGFLIKSNLFAPSELQPIMDDIEQQVDSLASILLSAGLITDPAPSLGFYQRMAALEKQFPGASVLLHKTPALPPSFQSLWTDPRLVDIAQQLLGGSSVDVAGHPVWNLRVKVPQTDSSVVPWHQDAAYLDPESAHTL
jgi:hypothetical protein